MKPMAVVENGQRQRQLAFAVMSALFHSPLYSPPSFIFRTPLPWKRNSSSSSPSYIVPSGSSTRRLVGILEPSARLIALLDVAIGHVEV